MHHVGRDELAHARWKSRRLLAVVSLSCGVGETTARRVSSVWITKRIHDTWKVVKGMSSLNFDLIFDSDL